jgi:hypothetical protein
MKCLKFACVKKKHWTVSKQKKTKHVNEQPLFSFKLLLFPKVRNKEKRAIPGFL